MADRKVGVVPINLFLGNHAYFPIRLFFFFLCIFLYFYESSLHILRLKNETNIPFNLLKTLRGLLPFALTAKLCMLDAAIFISYLVTSGGA